MDRVKVHFDEHGIKLVSRDPNFKSDVQLQAVSTPMNEKPDILIVRNPTTTLLARELKRAMEAGIKVIQVNMASNQLTDAGVGADMPKFGRMLEVHRNQIARLELRKYSNQAAAA